VSYFLGPPCICLKSKRSWHERLDCSWTKLFLLYSTVTDYKKNCDHLSKSRLTNRSLLFCLVQNCTKNERDRERYRTQYTASTIRGQIDVLFIAVILCFCDTYIYDGLAQPCATVLALFLQSVIGVVSAVCFSSANLSFVWDNRPIAICGLYEMALDAVCTAAVRLFPASPPSIIPFIVKLCAFCVLLATVFGYLFSDCWQLVNEHVGLRLRWSIFGSRHFFCILYRS